MNGVSILEHLLEILFPAGTEERLVRELTPEKISELTLHTAIPHGIALLRFREPTVRALIHRAKYAKDMKALDILGSVLHEHLIRDALPRVIVPIPLSPSRLRERGFNQSVLIGERAVRGTRCALRDELLSRVRDTVPQTQLTRSARLTNLQGSFEVPPSAQTEVRGVEIVLLDDVSTTGATFSEARRALLDAGAAEVQCVALAH